MENMGPPEIDVRKPRHRTMERVEVFVEFDIYDQSAVGGREINKINGFT